MSDKKNCSYIQKLNAFIDRELSKKDFEEIKEHLKNCRFCQNEIRELNSINQFLSSYNNNEVPEYLNQRILASVREISLEKNRGFLEKYVLKFSIAASVLLSLYSGILLSDIAFSAQQNSDLEFGQETLYSYFEGVE